MEGSSREGRRLRRGSSRKGRRLWKEVLEKEKEGGCGEEVLEKEGGRERERERGGTDVCCGK